MLNSASLILSNEEPSTIDSIFFGANSSIRLKVPDYQRAFSWKEKQVGLFLSDLRQQHALAKKYYFGHFIAEKSGDSWEIVDGQQRLTVFVLFLAVCRVLFPSSSGEPAFRMIGRFTTVSYDAVAFGEILANLEDFLSTNPRYDSRNLPADREIREGFRLTGDFTLSQRRLVLALLQIHQEFVSGKMDRSMIAGYIKVVTSAHASLHLTRDKSVAVQIFEMHNTRGVPLTTLEIVKAILMKHVFDHGGDEAETKSKVEAIQKEFGLIYGLEEKLAAQGFRGEMTSDQLLKLHLRVVDDGTKKTRGHLDSPQLRASSDDLVVYVRGKLHGQHDSGVSGVESSAGVDYALALATEFRRSMEIYCEILPEWDKEDSLVGDVLILEKELSCQLFLLVCRSRGSDDLGKNLPSRDELRLWERLLFTHDFHDNHHNLKVKDDFPGLFDRVLSGSGPLSELLEEYLKDGFRPDKTAGLQSIVVDYLNLHRGKVLNEAFHWWRGKMTYVLYKYEVSKTADMRQLMKDGISLEHILPQNWQWTWLDGVDNEEQLSDEDRRRHLREVGSYINGIGNLLILPPGENSSWGDTHPKDKEYVNRGGSYHEHNQGRSSWNSSLKWGKMIKTRGEDIFIFMLSNLVGVSGHADTARVEGRDLPSE